MIQKPRELETKKRWKFKKTHKKKKGSYFVCAKEGYYVKECRHRKNTFKDKNISMVKADTYMVEENFVAMILTMFPNMNIFLEN